MMGKGSECDYLRQRRGYIYNSIWLLADPAVRPRS